MNKAKARRELIIRIIFGILAVLMILSSFAGALVLI